MTNANQIYEPAIYITPEEIKRHASLHKGNPIIQQLLFVTRENARLSDALWQINAASSDCPPSEGLSGNDWIAAVCRETSAEALGLNTPKKGATDE